MLRLSGSLVVLGAVLVVTTCRDDRGPAAPTEATIQSGPSFATTSGPVTLVGAGNVAKCNAVGDNATAALLDGIPGTVLSAGDAAYDNGTLIQYNICYNPSWGRHRARTQPTPGERDYKTANASGYFTYFGAAAGDPKNGYYSYDAGSWHVIVLNSGSPQLVPTTATSPQVQWLRADLAAHLTQCTLAYWHHPLFDSKDNPNTSIRPLWDVLYAAGVDVVVNAHYAFYERFAPQTPAGAADPGYGIREFIVGTGGAEHVTPNHVRANSEVRNGTAWGVLKLTLDAGTYAWEFVPVAGQTFHDSGSGACHGAPPLSVNAGPDRTTPTQNPVSLSVAFTDPGGTGGGPWTYSILWGDGASSTGTAPSSPFTAAHAFATEGLDSVRVTVTNAVGAFGTDSLAVRVRTVLAGAGDIADCAKTGDSLTANLLDTIPGVVFAAGDNAYPNGTSAQYTSCYGPTWGRHKARTKPVPGNHDYSTPGASGYFGYFGAAAGDPTKGYYSYELGDWHIVALNSSIAMSIGSPQEQWLRADLAASTKRCTLAYWHHPLFSSGNEGPHVETLPLYQALYDAGAEVVIVGHDHDYERFAPQSPTGAADPAHGIREFVVGTGGGGLFQIFPPAANSEVLDNQTLGVIRVELHADGYDWTFLPIAGKTFTDAGSGSCHDAPSAANHSPTAVPGAAATGTEGTAVSFDGTGSSDPDGDAVTYAWSFGDGTSGTGAKPGHTYADNGSYTVTLTVTDARGAASAPATTSATIANVAPAVNAGGPQTVNAGSPFTLNATFGDPGANDAPWSYAIDWGDGSPPTSGSTTSQSSPITATHSYGGPGTSTGHVAVTDKDAGSGSASFTVSAAQQVVTLVGAGNIARCDRTGDEATAAILDTMAGTVFLAGDGAYPGGTPTAYQTCYDPTWGRQKARTYPVPGHRDYDSSATATGYFGYFGAAAGDPTKGYYSFDLGAWHVVMLNSNSAFVATAAGSPQETWLKADLAATTQRCVLAVWHHPRFYSTTSTSFSPTSSVKPFWDDLYAAGAELIINAHMRDYERFAPQTSAGVADPVNGIREIIVGTGGEGLDAPNTLITPNSEVNLSGVYGVLKLTLADGSYAWQFVPAAGQTASDAGSGSCH
jgi:PKD repeat protein